MGTWKKTYQQLGYNPRNLSLEEPSQEKMGKVGLLDQPTDPPSPEVGPP